MGSANDGYKSQVKDKSLATGREQSTMGPLNFRYPNTEKLVLTLFSEYDERQYTEDQNTSAGHSN